MTFPADDPLKFAIRPSIGRLEEILVAPFGKRTTAKASDTKRDFTSEEVVNTIDQIRQAILPVLRKQKSRLSSQ